MKQTKAPDEILSEEWAAIPWRKLEQHRYHLQKRIFKASERGDLKTVHKLQKLLMRISVRPAPRSTTSDAGQSGQENRRDRWDKIHPTNR